jgi:two-component system, NarL family, nitrate/nitrite response regulator NarL
MQTCLICDDHALVRDALAGVLRQSWPDVCLTFAADFPTAWAAAGAPFDLCLCDLVMPGADPLHGITHLQSIAPDMPVLVVTSQQDDTLMLALINAGVAGFVPKASTSPIISAAVTLALAGGRYLPPRIIGLAMALPAQANPLTPRQTEVIKAAAQGRTTKEIARDLGLAPSTVKTHLDQAMVTLGAKNRTEAVRLAAQSGIVGR